MANEMNTDITRGYGYLVPRTVLANWPHAIVQDHKSGLIQHWAGVMESCRRSALPIVRADRLRTAAELRAELARELAAAHAVSRKVWAFPIEETEIEGDE